jgi:hypothetical protein
VPRVLRKRSENNIVLKLVVVKGRCFARQVRRFVLYHLPLKLVEGLVPRLIFHFGMVNVLNKLAASHRGQFRD